jgi:hypothetical protein
MMETANDAAGGDLMNDVRKAAICVTGPRAVVEGEKNASERLVQEQKQSDAAEDLRPSGGGRNVFEEKVSKGRLKTGTAIEPDDGVMR